MLKLKSVAAPDGLDVVIACGGSEEHNRWGEITIHIPGETSTAVRGGDYGGKLGEGKTLRGGVVNRLDEHSFDDKRRSRPSNRCTRGASSSGATSREP